MTICYGISAKITLFLVCMNDDVEVVVWRMDMQINREELGANTSSNSTKSELHEDN